MSNEEIAAYVDSLDNEVKDFKENLYKLSWYMRGGVTSEQLMLQLTSEDRNILNKIVNDNIENTKNAKMPLI